MTGLLWALHQMFAALHHSDVSIVVLIFFRRVTMVVVQCCWQLLEGRSLKELTLVGTLCVLSVCEAPLTPLPSPSDPSSRLSLSLPPLPSPPLSQLTTTGEP